MLLLDLQEALLIERVQPIIAYHGTSSKFLRSILKHGMQVDPKEKVWADDPHASQMQTSRKSYGGIYFTRNLMTAASSSTNATKKFGGNPLFVIASIVPEAAIPDEDAMRFTMQGILGHFGPLDANAKFYAAWFAANPDSEKLSAMVDEAFNDFIKKSRVKEKHHIKEVFREAVIVLLDRYVAHEGTGFGASKMQDGFRAGMRERLKDEYSLSREDWNRLDDEAYARSQQWFKSLNKEDLEKRSMQAIDRLSKHYRSTARDIRKDDYTHVRIQNDVTFSGRNRITGIVEEMPHSPDDYTINYAVRYGTIPQAFYDATEERRGSYRIVK